MKGPVSIILVCFFLASNLALVFGSGSRGEKNETLGPANVVPVEVSLELGAVNLNESINHSFISQKASLVEPEVSKRERDTINDEPIRPNCKATDGWKVVKKEKYTATFYYKPVPGQKRYSRGNYKKEVHLNGKGKKTSCGLTPNRLIVAADPKVLKPGTRFRYKGEIYTIGDSGNRIKKRRLDFYAGEGDRGLNAAIEGGIRVIEIEILAKK